MRTSVLLMASASALSCIGFAIGHASDGRDLRRHSANDMTSGHLGHIDDGNGGATRATGSSQVMTSTIDDSASTGLGNDGRNPDNTLGAGGDMTEGITPSPVSRR
jgi:hypothetical protein